MGISQKQRILNYLLINKSITTWESYELFGDTRLSDKIYCLKKDGYKFEEEWLENKNRYGEKVRFKKYILKEEQ